ncbi:MAG: SH3 domain-containing protein [Anaerolineales bacterium]
MRYSTIFLLASSLAVLSGCGINISSENTVPTPVFITATLPATAIPLPTVTPIPPTPVPTISPIDGTTTTQVNVRAQTSTASDNLGTIAQFSKVQIIGKDPSTSWYQIIYAGSPSGIGWIRAEYVQVDAAVEVPVIESVTGNRASVSGLVIQKINVRSGPGTSFDTLGELNPNDVVFISGKDASGTWMQIEFANSADGKGWAALEFLKVENTDSLPVVGSTSPTPEVVVIETVPQASPLPSVILDGDSMEAPLARAVFSPLGSRMIRLNSSISSPDGDTEDWVEFTSYNGSIAIQIFCSDGPVQVELQSNGQALDTFPLACAEKRLLNVNANQTILLRLSEADPNGSHRTEYTLVLENIK